MDRFDGTNICASATVCAYFRIDFIDIALRNCFYRTFIDAGSACDAIFADNMSHDSIELNE
jgi:hypothetical protein